MSAGCTISVLFGDGFDPVEIEFPDCKSADLFASAFAPCCSSRIGLAGSARRRAQSLRDADFRLSEHSGGWCIKSGSGEVLAEGKSFAQAVGFLDFAFEGRLRKASSSAVASLHSCGVLVPGGVVELLGVSGSGKTTLGLACSASGMRHIGDEFGFVELATGMSWHAEYPVGVKCGLRPAGKDHIAALPCVRPVRGLRCETPFGISSTLYARKALSENLGLRLARADERRPLKAMVSVRRVESAAPSLRALSLREWAGGVMPSVDAGLARHELFSALISLAACHDVEFLHLTYPEAFDGASLLLRHFRSL